MSGSAVTSSSIKLNGASATRIARATPGQPVTISANWADYHPGFCPGCVDFLATAYEISFAAAGALRARASRGRTGVRGGRTGSGPQQTRHLQHHRRNRFIRAANSGPSQVRPRREVVVAVPPVVTDGFCHERNLILGHSERRTVRQN